MALLLIALTLLPFVELFLLIRIGRMFGVGITLAYLVAIAFLGTSLARSQGRRVIEIARAALAQGRVPEEGALGGLLVLLGGLLLIVPGVITDVLGLLCLVPFTRRAISRQLGHALASRVAASNVRVENVGFSRPPRERGPARGVPPARGEIIDTEGEDITNQDPPR